MAGESYASAASPVTRRSRAPRAEDALEFVERNALWILGGLMALDAALLLYMGRGLTFFYDDWDFVTHDYGGGIHSLLVAHVGNLVIFPVAIYKLLFHLVGLNHYAVFRLMIVVLHLICAGLVFVLASRRVTRVQALLATTLVLFLGAAWEDLLWAFQVTYVLAVAGGLGAWLLLERRDRIGDVGAMLCVIVALGSSSLGVAILVGVAAELAWERRWHDAWIVAVPAGLYVLWYLGYGESQVTGESLIHAPGFAADLAAAAFGGLAGRALDWGRPLALLGLLLLLRRLWGALSVTPRLVGLIAAALCLWGITAAARSTVSSPETSRYVYFGAILIVLVVVELLRGVPFGGLATAVAAVLVLYFAVTGLTAMHDGAARLRSVAKPLSVELGAMEIAAPYTPPTYQPDAQRAPQIVAGPYLHTVRAIGSSPAAGPRAIAAADAPSRAAADAVLLALEPPRLMPAGSRDVTAPTPVIATLSSGTQSVAAGHCRLLTPLPGTTASATLPLPANGAVLADRGASPTMLAVRRFGDAFVPVATVAAHERGTLTAQRDGWPGPWQLQISSASPVLLCGR